MDQQLKDWFSNLGLGLGFILACIELLCITNDGAMTMGRTLVVLF